MIETVVYGRLLKYLDNNKLISNRKYGFRKERSTEDLTTFLSRKLLSSIHFLREKRIVVLDISNAFDTV